MAASRCRLFATFLLSLSFSVDAAINPSSVTKEDVIDASTPDGETSLDLGDFASGASLQPVDLRALGIRVPDDPTLAAGKREGDLALNTAPSTFVQNSNLDALGVQSKSAIRSVWRRWTDGVIPYTLSARYGKYSRSVIARAMDEIHKQSCVRFEPRGSQRDYVYIHPDDGCYSLVGRTGGRQPLSLDAGCIDLGTVMHELMHTVGFFHEQSRNDREDWIDIAWSNVLAEARDQFERYSLSTIDHLNVEYDYDSLMHYGRYAFTRNGRPTILPKKAGGMNMGQRDGLSERDIQKLRLLYGEQCFEEGSGGSVVDGDGKPKPKPDTEVTTAQLRCQDDERYAFRCRLWSTRIFNYCETLEEVRTVLCAKSCKSCVDGPESGGSSGGSGGEPPEPVPVSVKTTPSPAPTISVSVCKDNNPGCEKWRSKGFCSSVNFAAYMRQTCAKSCRLCGDGAGTITGEARPAPLLPPDGDSGTNTSGQCGDSDDYEVVCKLARMFNRCNPSTASEAVKQHCKKSCAMC